MIRTAILAGLFLVMLSIAYTRIDLPPIPVRDTALITEPPPVEPSLPSEAAKPLPKRSAAQAPRAVRPHIEAPQVKEAAAEEAVADEPVVAEPVKAIEPLPRPAPVHVAVAPVAPTPAAPVTNAPVSLLPPPESAAPRIAAVEPAAGRAPAPLIPPAAPVEQKIEAPAAVPAPTPAAAPAVEKPPVLTKADDMPLIQVPQRPVVAPWEAPTGTTHNSGAALATVGAAPAAEAPKFMTPQERSRELYRLARDMEDLFITKLTH